jgi:oligoribonuclease NrnB/cAMP/cGMP phosphodiesterase (DHH superfamily)
MQIKIKFTRQTGKAFLNLDATELHEYLKEQGATLNAEGTEFADQPYSEHSEIDTYSNRIAPRLLLKVGLQSVDLGAYYRQPVGIDILNQLADRAGDVVRVVVDHYRPIEISVVVTGKKAA